MSEEELAESMRRRLKGTRYLIVLDDVWSPKVWDDIKVAFPDNMNGCRILVTSRISEVATRASRNPPYLLPLLSKEDAWLLLSKKAFRGDVCPKELERDGRKIVEKCKCLPLALVVVGGLLATKEKSTRVWSDVSDNLRWYLNKNLEDCIDIIALSYDELPPHLKLCFLYFGVFPEDFEISARQLIRLWVAEGFIITKDKSRKLEDIAEIYLENLIDRNLIMVARRRSDGGVKTCVVHDLLRDLCISRGAKENFFVVHVNATTTNDRPRRLSIHCSTSKYMSSTPACDPSLDRTLLCFGDPDSLSDGNFRSLYKGFCLLRVLDLGSSVATISIPTQIEKLIHLRYLKINAPKLTDIPSSISNLPNLQTLDLRQSSIKYLSNNFWKMQQLRHLFLSGDCNLSHVNGVKDMKLMCNLQTLSTVSSNILSMVDGDNIFPNLTKVGVKASKLLMYKEVFYSDENFQSIQSLKIVEGSHLLSHRGTLTIKPSSNLTKLTLIQTKIRSPVIEMLGRLPNLEILKLLKKSFAEVRLECGEGWFPKLQVLHMAELDLKEWNFRGDRPAALVEAEDMIQDHKSCVFCYHLSGERCTGSENLQQLVSRIRQSAPVLEMMVSLQYLSISKCRDLAKIPVPVLKKSNTLRHVKASWCRRELESTLRELGENINYEIQNYK